MILLHAIGDHIRVTRYYGLSEHGDYDHHMLVVSVDVKNNQIHIIHYTSQANGAASVREDTVPFKRGEKIDLLKYSGVKCFSPEESIERARSRLGETEYDMLSNNCECFVNWAIIDKAISIQVQEGLKSTAIGALNGAVKRYIESSSLLEIIEGFIDGARDGYDDHRKNTHCSGTEPNSRKTPPPDHNT